MININKDFISQKNINGTGNPCKYIVIHETDNYNRGSDARKHAQAQHDGDFTDMSVHYYSGSDGVYQAAEHTCKCWHIGRTYVRNPNNPDCTNNNSIGIEICVNSDGNYQVARQNAIELTKYIIQITGIPASRVIRHYDAKGKYCPRKMMDNPSLWQDFKNQLTGCSGIIPPDISTGWKAIGTAICTGDGVYYRPRPTMNCTPYGQLRKGNRFEVNGEEKNGWINAKVQDTLCWISKNFVQYDGQPAPTPPAVTNSYGWKSTGTATCTGRGVRIRSTPELGNNILYLLDKGNRFEVNGENQNGWIKVRAAGKIGWMSEKYVKYDQENSKSSKIAEDGYWGTVTTRRLQQIFGTGTDGIVSNQLLTYKRRNPGIVGSFRWETTKRGGSVLIKAIQNRVGVPADGYIGPNTIKAIQRRLGCVADGFFSKPSTGIKALQHWANQQK